MKYGDASLALRFDACRVLLGGEFAGNIELDVACDAAGIDSVMQYLHLQVAGGPPSDTALGSGAYAPGVELVFWMDPCGLAEPPEEITLLWGETPIARISPALKDSVPIERQLAFTEPSEILTSLPVATSSHVRLAANREKGWLLLAGMLVACGALVGAGAPGLQLSDPMLNWLLGGALVTGGTGVGFLLAWTPYRQVWLDRDRRRVIVVEGRTRSPQATLADAPGRSLDEFDHVRLYQRWIPRSVDGDDQEIWHVALEGRIPFASTDGVVHLDGGALPVDGFTSEFAARRCAAVVASLTGLRILDTGHDRTA